MKLEPNLPKSRLEPPSPRCGARYRKLSRRLPTPGRGPQRFLRFSRGPGAGNSPSIRGRLRARAFVRARNPIDRQSRDSQDIESNVSGRTGGDRGHRRHGLTLRTVVIGFRPRPRSVKRCALLIGGHPLPDFSGLLVARLRRAMGSITPNSIGST